MENPKENRERLIKSWDERKIKEVKESFQKLVDLGPEEWTQNYTLSYIDKITQIDLMIEYFEDPTVEEYEKCQFLLDVKNNMNTHRYML